MNIAQAGTAIITVTALSLGTALIGASAATATPTAPSTSAERVSVSQLNASAGWTGIWPTTSGTEFWLNSDLSNSVADALTSGSLSEVLAQIPGGKLVGDVLSSLGAGRVRDANANQTGVVILLPWLGFPSVRAQ